MKKKKKNQTPSSVSELFDLPWYTCMNRGLHGRLRLILIDRLSKHGVVHHHLAPNPRVHAGDSPKQKQTFTTKM